MVTGPVLLAEDNPADVHLFRELSGIPTDRIIVASDGSEAVEYVLENCGLPGEPSLVVLDLNLPKLDARFVLNVMKSVARLRRIPVVILTSWRSERDAKSYVQAEGYFEKPVDLDAYEKLAKEIAELWRKKRDQQRREDDDPFTRTVAKVVFEAGLPGIFGDSEWASIVSHRARHDVLEVLRHARICIQLRRRRPELAAELREMTNWPRVRDRLELLLGDYAREMRPGSFFRSPPWSGICSEAVRQRIDELWSTQLQASGALGRADAAVAGVSQTLGRCNPSVSDPCFYEIFAKLLELEESISELPLRVFLPRLEDAAAG
jgi:CheY-like chemotaxis protein